MNDSKAEILQVSDIRVDEDIQVRMQTDENTVRSYSDAIEDGVTLPPVTCFRDTDGTVWLSDGFHRYEAARATTGRVSAIVLDGSRRDARWHALKANSTHGKPLSNADKRKAVELMLTDSEWSQMSDREIARHIGVSNKFVSGMRRERECDRVTVSMHANISTTDGVSVHSEEPNTSRQPSGDTVQDRLWEMVDSATAGTKAITPSVVSVVSLDHPNSGDIDDHIESGESSIHTVCTQGHDEVRSEQMLSQPHVARSSEITPLSQIPAAQVEGTRHISDDLVNMSSEPGVIDDDGIDTSSDLFTSEHDERAAAAKAALDRLSELEETLGEVRDELAQAHATIQRLSSRQQAAVAVGPTPYELRLERELAIMMLSNPRASAMRDMTAGQFDRGDRPQVELDAEVSKIRARFGS